MFIPADLWVHVILPFVDQPTGKTLRWVCVSWHRFFTRRSVRLHKNPSQWQKLATCLWDFESLELHWQEEEDDDDDDYDEADDENEDLPFLRRVQRLKVMKPDDLGDKPSAVMFSDRTFRRMLCSCPRLRCLEVSIDEPALACGHWSVLAEYLRSAGPSLEEVLLGEMYALSSANLELLRALQHGTPRLRRLSMPLDTHTHIAEQAAAMADVVRAHKGRIQRLEVRLQGDVSQLFPRSTLSSERPKKQLLSKMANSTLRWTNSGPNSSRR
jgi:hypothetical protein